MKAFTLAFNSINCVVTEGIVLRDCVNKKREHVIGIPVITSENSVVEFASHPGLRKDARIFSIDFNPAISKIAATSRDAYEDAALVYIPSSSHLVYDTSSIFESRGYGCFMGGVPTAGRNSARTDALMIVGSSECVYLDCNFKSEKLRTRQVISFDGFELSAGIVTRLSTARAFEPKSPAAGAPTFGTSLGDLFNKTNK